MTTVGRNDPCPCGSGKKFKKCCLAKSFAPATEETVRSRLVDELLAFARSKQRKAVVEASDYFWTDFSPAETLGGSSLEGADINFWEWFIHDYRIKGKKTLIELWREKTRIFSQMEESVLNKMKDSVLSLYEVQKVFPEEGLILEDLLLGGQFRVKEKMATRQLVPYDIFAARLLEIDGHYLLSGSAYPFRVGDKASMIGDIRKWFHDFKRGHPGVSMRDFLKSEGVLFNDLWSDYFRNPRQPILMTSDGQPVLFSKAFFEFQVRKSVIEALMQANWLEEIGEDSFQWREPKDREQPVILGNLEVDEHTLVLECASRERLERGKALIISNLRDLVVHKTDMFQDPLMALRDKIPEQSAKETGIPPEIEKQLHEEFMRKHYQKWLDEKLPALHGKSPREMVKRPWGKKKVIDLLKLLENLEERKKKDGRLSCDVSWLWEALGLDKE